MNDKPLPVASIFSYARLLWPRWQRRRVHGRSMAPTLPDGTTVLLDTAAYRHADPQVGDIVLAQHPYEPNNKMIKRITAVTEDGRYFLRGDNPNATETTDSRSFGTVPRSHILARITYRFS